MRENWLCYLFVFIALVAVTTHCKESTSNTEDVIQTHSIEKRDAKDDYVNGMTGVGVLFGAAAVITSAVPPVSLFFALASAFAQGVAFMVNIGASPAVDKEAKKKKEKLYKQINKDVAAYYKDLKNSTDTIISQLEELQQDVEVVSRNLLYAREYEPLNTFYNNYFLSNGSDRAKQNLITAADDYIIDRILNGIGAHLLDQSYVKNAITGSNYNKTAFIAWMKYARTHLYHTLLVKSAALVVEKTDVKTSLEMKTSINKTQSILENLLERGRNLYWENDKKRMTEALKDVSLLGFNAAAKNVFRETISKYEEFGDNFLAVGVLSEDVDSGKGCGPSSEHIIKHTVANPQQNILNFTMQKYNRRNGEKIIQCFIVYYIHFPVNQIRQKEYPKKSLAYLKYIPQLFNETGKMVDQRRRVYGYTFKPNATKIYNEAIAAAKKRAFNETKTKQEDCIFHLARFRQSEWPQRYEYSTLAIWTNQRQNVSISETMAGQLNRNSYDYLDTLIICPSSINFALPKLKNNV